MDVDRVAAAELARRALSGAHDVRASAEPIASLRFGGSAAGRDYVAHGNALASALSGLRARMVARADFVESLGGRLVSSTETIAAVDRAGAQRLRDSGESTS